MKKLILFTSLTALLFLSSSCGGGFINSNQLSIDGIDGGNQFIVFDVKF